MSRQLPSQVEFDKKNADPVPPSGKIPKGNLFGLVLYPDCDHHCKLLAMFERSPMMYKAVYILHDRDVWTQKEFDLYCEEHGDSPNWSVGDHKKAHWHVMVNYGTNTSASAFAKFCKLDHVELISNKLSYLSYMIHDTPDSWDKFQYDRSDLKGYEKTIRLLLDKNLHFVQLQQFVKMVECGLSLSDMVGAVQDSPDFDTLVNTFDKYEHFIVAMSNQFDNRRRFLRNEKNC